MRKGDVVERLEPKFYLLKYRNNEDRINKSKFAKYHFNRITKLISDGTHFTPKYTDEGVKFLSVKDVRSFEITYNNSKFITVKEADFLDNRCKPQRNDVLLTKIGATFGFAAVVNSDERFQIFVSVALLRPDDKIILPEFFTLCINSNFIYLQFERVIKGAGVPDLHLEDIREIKIPVPPIEVQTQIIEKFEAAYNAKRAKETEAKSLLDGIDAYLLERLGIKTPVESDAKRTFFTRASKLSGSRFDPSFYKPNLQNLVGALEKQSHKKLREIVKFSSESWNQKDFFDSTFPYIEISEIDLGKGEINNVNHIPLSEAPSRAKMIVRSGDIIVSTTRPSRGAIAKITDKENFSIASTGFAVIRNVDSKFVIKDYLHSVLRHRVCLLQMEQRSSGGNYPAITIEELGNLLIPLPPRSIQAEIAAHIQSIRTRARELEHDAHAGVERAKREVEQMILFDGELKHFADSLSNDH